MPKAARAISPENLPDGLQRVILAVKSPATQHAIKTIAPHLALDGLVVSAQNGLNEIWISDAVGADRTIGCFVNFSATYMEPGVVALGGPGAFWIGELDGKMSGRLANLQHDLSAWSVAGQERRQVRCTPNIWGYLWGKMGYGAMLFGTALTNESMADGIDKHRTVLRALAGEVLCVARAEGVHPLGFDGYDPDAITSTDANRANASINDLIAIRRADTQTHSGVWRDLAVRKRKTEVDAQFGPILDRADFHHIDTPLLRRMVQMIHEIEDHQRELQSSNLDELAGVCQNAA